MIIMTLYSGVNLKDTIVIKKLYTVHYYEYSKEYRFTGESHNFWEFVYVDKGEVTVVADEKSYILKQGSSIFHKPNEWHNIYANGTVAPNIVIFTFESASKDMSFFENKILFVGQEQKRLISKIITEYTNAFSSPLNDPYTNRLIRRSDAFFASEQLLKLYLTELLITFIRSNNMSGQKTMANINQNNSTMNLILNYMNENIGKNITLKDLMRYSGTNRTTIENIFRENFEVGAIDYFIKLKIEYAKKYLRENNYNITQISEILGYSSIHYFSRQFKKVTGMNPTEYIMSIKAMMRE